MIRSLATADFETVLAINAACAPHVAPLDGAELERLSKLAALAIVIEPVTGIDGYLLAMLDNAQYDGEEFLTLRTSLPRPFLYIDQVAIASDARRGGFAAALYAHAASWCEGQGIGRLCCEVNLEPRNEPSLRFHAKVGFTELGPLDTGDGRRVMLFSKERSFRAF